MLSPVTLRSIGSWLETKAPKRFAVVRLPTGPVDGTFDCCVCYGGRLGRVLCAFFSIDRSYGHRPLACDAAVTLTTAIVLPAPAITPPSAEVVASVSPGAKFTAMDGKTLTVRAITQDGQINYSDGQSTTKLQMDNFLSLVGLHHTTTPDGPINGFMMRAELLAEGSRNYCDQHALTIQEPSGSRKRIATLPILKTYPFQYPVA